jgi:putative intracellular protease/amidase
MVEQSLTGTSDIKPNERMKKILMILTSHKEMENTDSTTGVWLGEFTDPYYEFIDKGYEVTLASPKGGTPPVDPLSKLTENITASNRRFDDDEVAKAAFNNTHTLSDINVTGYDALFIPGGHGPIWDLATNEMCGKIILEFLSEQKYVAAVCHGPAALIEAAELQPGLLAGKRITAFSNTEETMVMRSKNVPYELETRLKELGADYHAALIPFTAHLEKDGLLITGQNPLSAGPAAKALIKALEENGA